MIFKRKLTIMINFIFQISTPVPFKLTNSENQFQGLNKTIISLLDYLLSSTTLDFPIIF
jgi:hypothetical protein